jgi:hypothetical protein
MNDSADFEMGIKAMRTEDGGHECYDTQVSAATIYRFLKRGFLRIDDEHQRGRDTVTGRQQVDSEKVERWTSDLIKGNAILGTIMWNFRPEDGSRLRYDKAEGKLYISGEAYIPDSYHRHLALKQAYESASRGSGFNTDLLVSVRIWGVSAEEESRLFYALNQEGKPADATRAKWLHPKELTQKLASEFVRQSPHLGPDNVDTVRDRLSKRNPRLAAFGTISKAFEDHFDGVELGGDHLNETVTWMVGFWDKLVSVLPELGKLPLVERQRVRNESLVDSASAVNSFIALARRVKGSGHSLDVLDRLAQPVRRDDGSEISFFSRRNPLWADAGVVVPGEKTVNGKRTLTLRNSRQARSAILLAVLKQTGIAAGREAAAAEPADEIAIQAPLVAVGSA